MKRPDQLKSDFIQQVCRRFPALQNQSLENLLSENLFSPAQVQISKSHWQDIKEFVRLAGALSESESYNQIWSKKFKADTGLNLPKNHSICMSYDFHLSNDNLKLIEINTNASFLVLGQLFYESQKIENPCGATVFEQLQMDILNEVSSYSQKSQSLKVGIVDEAPEQQKLFSEFLCYKELFKTWGWDAEIYDSLQTPLDVDFVYNRDTDFYFQSPRTQKLKDLFNAGKTAISPQPYEYCKLADKERMLEWMQTLDQYIPNSQDLNLFRSILLKSTPLNENTKEQVWAQRKQLFIKPFRSFGSKQSYRAASISRRLFDELVLQSDLVAQEFAPAGAVSVTTEKGSEDFKFDLRVYAYRGEVRSIIARAYQGQVTNLKTPYGGFAVVQIV